MHFGLPFAPFSPLFSEINEQIGRLVSGGFFNLWKINTLKKEWKVKVDEIGPQVLTMDQMEVAFLVSLLPLVLAMMAFIAEVSVSWKKIFVERIEVLFVIRAFYRFYRKH